MANDAAHTRPWQIGEVVFGLPLLAALALGWAVPLAFPGGPFAPVRLLAGTALIVTGVALIVLARREFARRGQPTDPGRPTGAIVTGGVFAVSRNPLYLGAASAILGVALFANLPWVAITLLPALLACHRVLIVPEERYLAAKFGADYRAYSAAVCRWLGRPRHSRQPSR